MEAYEFYDGQRVVVVAEEPDRSFRDNGSEIPIGTTGTIRVAYEESATNPLTDEDEPIHDVTFDMPYTGRTGHFNRDGLVGFQVFSFMIRPLDDEPEQGFEAVDFDGLFDD